MTRLGPEFVTFSKTINNPRRHFRDSTGGVMEQSSGAVVNKTPELTNKLQMFDHSDSHAVESAKTRFNHIFSQ